MKTFAAALALLTAASAANACELESSRYRSNHDGTTLILDGVLSGLSGHGRVYFSFYADEDLDEYLGRAWTYADPGGGFTVYADVPYVPDHVWFAYACD